jgi:hypothetical protein
LGGWNKRQEEAQTEYEEALKAISGERSRGAAGVASRSRTKGAVRDAAASGRETAMAKHIGAFGRLSEKSKEEALKSIGFTTAQVPKVFRHPDDTMDRFSREILPEETYTQYTGPKGKVFTMPEKAIRSAIAADRIKIKGEGKKQKKEDAEIYRVQSLATIAASIAAGKAADTYEQTKEREGEQYELAKVRSEARTAETRKWLKGEGEKRDSAAFELGQYAAGAMLGTPQEEVFANLTALRGGKPLATTSEEQGRAYLSGSQKREATTRDERNALVSSVALRGGSPEELATFAWPWKEGYTGDARQLKDEFALEFNEGNALWRSAEAGLVARQKGIALRAKTTWRVGAEEALKDLWIQEGTTLGLKGDSPETLRPKLTPIQVRMPDGWELTGGERVPTEASLDILQAGSEEGSLYKVREIGRLTGKNPRIISVADISRQYNAALLRNTSEAQQLVARAMDENRTGRDRVEDTADAIRATKEGPVRDEALRVFYANEAVIALKDIPRDEKDKRTAWKMAMEAHSPAISPSDGEPMEVPLTKAGGEPKWAIVVDWYGAEDASGNPVPAVYAADNPAATLSDNDKVQRDAHRDIKEMEVMKQRKISFPTKVKGTRYSVTPLDPPKGTKKSRGNR